MNLTKIALTAIVIAVALLLVDLCLCMVAITSPSIGADPTYAKVVGGTFVAAMTSLIVAIVIGGYKLIKDLTS
jgi:hypothetical protein